MSLAIDATISKGTNKLHNLTKDDQIRQGVCVVRLAKNVIINHQELVVRTSNCFWGDQNLFRQMATVTAGFVNQQKHFFIWSLLLIQQFSMTLRFLASQASTVSKTAKQLFSQPYHHHSQINSKLTVNCSRKFLTFPSSKKTPVSAIIFGAEKQQCQSSSR